MGGQVKPLQESRETGCSLYQVEVSEELERSEWTWETFWKLS